MIFSFAFVAVTSWGQMRQSLIQSSLAPEILQSGPELKTTPKAVKNSNGPGNLPSYLRVPSHSSQGADSRIQVPTAKTGYKFTELKPGDVIQAQILESAVAFLDAKAPVRALIHHGQLKGSIFLGEATLEKNSKRILINFSKFRKPNDETTYQLSASVLDSKGILGLEGKLISGEPTYFAGELVAAGAAGYADSTVERNQNAFGNNVDVPSTSNYAKKAIASALSRTADRFSEKLKSAPEYSFLEGPIQIQVIITDEIKTN